MTYSGFDITDRVYLITGGTSGIGRALALAIAQAGARVITGSTNPEKVSAMRDELGNRHEVIRLDVTSDASVCEAVATTVKRFGRLDSVVHSAGIIARKPSLDVTTEEFERIVKVNLTGSFIVAREAARIMRKQPTDDRGQRGSIVFVASLNSFISLTEVLAYACSKSGVLGLVRGLANEWAGLGIRVNAIAPGVFPTALNRELVEETSRGAWLKAHTPLGRFGDPEELIGAVIYLTSGAASFTTGETIVIDGGFLAKGV